MRYILNFNTVQATPTLTHAAIIHLSLYRRYIFSLHYCAFDLQNTQLIRSIETLKCSFKQFRAVNICAYKIKIVCMNTAHTAGSMVPYYLDGMSLCAVDVA